MNAKSRYVFVDSHDYTTAEGTGETRFDVQLSDPIVGAHSVRVNSFSMKHELWNVRAPNNWFWFGRLTHDTPAAWGTMPTNIVNDTRKITIRPGHYTLPELVTEINAEITKEWTVIAPIALIQIQPRVHSLKDVLKYKLVVTEQAAYTSASMQTYLWLAYPAEQDFKNSVLFRLGLGQQQIIRMTNREDYEFYGTNARVGNYGHMGLLSSPYNETLCFFTDSNHVSMEYNANNAGTETQPHVFLKSSLATSSTQRSKRIPSTGHVTTVREDILARIPTNGNVLSYIHYTPPYRDYFNVPVNSGTPVTSFSLTLADDNDKVFAVNEHTGFQLMLEFKITEEHGQDMELAKINQKLAFLSRHNPLH